MKNNVKFLTIMLLLFHLCVGGATYAEEVPEIGGQVTSKGKITFYEEKTESSLETEVSKKKLPKTGERNYAFLFMLLSFSSVGCSYALFRVKEKIHGK